MEFRPSRIHDIIDIGDDTNLAVSAPVTLTGDTIGWDSTLTDNLAWSDGGEATITHTFDVSGQSVTMSITNGVVTFSHALTVVQTCTVKRLLAGGITG